MTGSKISLLMLALFVAWGLGMASRNVWTPDEPRELALSASQVGTFLALPTLGGNTFAEKPPLAYWLSGAAMDVLGVSGAAARAPFLIYALIAIAAVFQLGKQMGTPATGTLAALIFATSWLVFETQIWLACDALLLAAVSVAILGVYMAFGPRRQWALGGICMHVGLLLALFTKSFAGWVVPLSTLFTYLLLERRLRELLRPAFWAPLIGSLALFVLWAWFVSRGVEGSAELRALFWDNLVGRFASYSDPSGSVLALGHRNWPGKYLVELPMYLLPWTPLVVGAFVDLWRNRRLPASLAGSTRFALCACGPALCIISIAATSRGIYAAPLIPGIALLVAVVITSPEPQPHLQGIVRSAFRWTAWVLMVTDGVILMAIVVLNSLHGRGGLAGLAVSLAGIAVVVAIGISVLRDSDVSLARRGAVEAVVIRLAAAHVVALIAISGALFPWLNRSQDLARIAAFIEESSRGRPLVLWLPDETTLAMSDLYMRKPVCAILVEHGTEEERARLLADCLGRFPRAAVVAEEACPKDECGNGFSQALRTDPMQRRHLALHDTTLLSAGVHPVEGIVRPGGRAYVVGYHLM
jgi:4-amino-4-deoxy-L-arabinose transferase-like glycosyltransferase